MNIEFLRKQLTAGKVEIEVVANGATEVTDMKPKCHNRCPAPLVRRRSKQTYERKGSPVQVIIKNIPVTACSLCGDETMPLATFGKINEILLPFHGKHNHVPKLPQLR